MYPLKDLTDADRDWLTRFAAEHPLAHGNSKVIVAAEAPKPAKKTIEVSRTEGTLETVQLCQPAIIRNQDGNFCYTFAMVHCMDIAGYVIQPGTIEAIQDHANAIDSENPWHDRDYGPSVQRMLTQLAPPQALHAFDHEESLYDWIRDQLRKGRPVLTLFPDNIWQALPPELVARLRGWHGDSMGHAVVINGFTYDHRTNNGTFHVINSWDVLQQWDLPVAAAQGYVDVYFSLSPKGEAIEKAAPLEIQAVKDLGAHGTLHLYAVTTNRGTKRVLAASEAQARSLVLSP